MSGLGKITYNTIVNAIKDWIKINCINISNYDSMNDCVKNGYNYTVGTHTIIIENQTITYTETAYATMNSSLVQVNASIVDNDINDFLTLINVSSRLDENISDNNFYNFINNIVSFCSSKLYFITSQTNNDSSSIVKYLVYNSNLVNYNNIKDITDAQDYLLIQAEPTKDLMDNLIDLIKSNIRVIPCNYSYTIS